MNYSYFTGILPAELLEDLFLDLPGGIMDPTSPTQNPHHFSVGDDDVLTKVILITFAFMFRESGRVFAAQFAQLDVNASRIPSAIFIDWIARVSLKCCFECGVFVGFNFYFQMFPLP